LSLPIAVTVHGGQDCIAHAMILWQYAFVKEVGFVLSSHFCCFCLVHVSSEIDDYQTLKSNQYFSAGLVINHC
jgi:hypothetical protein